MTSYFKQNTTCFIRLEIIGCCSHLSKVQATKIIVTTLQQIISIMLKTVFKTSLLCLFQICLQYLNTTLEKLWFKFSKSVLGDNGSLCMVPQSSIWYHTSFTALTWNSGLKSDIKGLSVHRPTMQDVYIFKDHTKKTVFLVYSHSWQIVNSWSNHQHISYHIITT